MGPFFRQVLVVTPAPACLVPVIGSVLSVLEFHRIHPVCQRLLVLNVVRDLLRARLDRGSNDVTDVRISECHIGVLLSQFGWVGFEKLSREDNYQ